MHQNRGTLVYIFSSIFFFFAGLSLFTANCIESVLIKKSKAWPTTIGKIHHSGFELTRSLEGFSHSPPENSRRSGWTYWFKRSINIKYSYRLNNREKIGTRFCFGNQPDYLKIPAKYSKGNPIKVYYSDSFGGMSVVNHSGFISLSNWVFSILLLFFAGLFGFWHSRNFESKQNKILYMKNHI